MIGKLAAAIAIIALFGALAGVVSVAVFTDIAANPTNQFTTGTVDISNSSEGSAIIFYSGMAPGDKVTQPLTVSNNGSLALRYSVTSLADNPDAKGLRAQLDLTIWDEAGEGDAGTACNATPPATVLYGPGDLGNDPAMNVIGNPSSGFQAGDRTLAASPTSEVLCFQAQLPSSTGNAYQGATTTATFTFMAEQTANNP